MLSWLDPAAPAAMMPRMKRSSAFLLALVASAPALAQAPLPAPPRNPLLSADRVQIASCLRQSGTATGACIGLVAVGCVRAATGDRRDSETTCARREEAVWRERLGFVSQAVMRAVGAGQRTQFAALQLSWEGYIAQKMCPLRRHSAARPHSGMQAGCELREVASRALELERFVTGRNLRRPASPPQIIR
jgi:hypothetical protein